GSSSVAPTGAQPPPAPVSPGIGPSPLRMYETSYDDYSAGRFDLAINGFEGFIQKFPKLSQAADAEYNIGMSYFNLNNWPEARDAFLRVTTDFAAQAQGNTVPDAYYKLGQTYERLNQIDAAKKAYETVAQKYPTAPSAVMAGNALARLNKRH